MTHEGAELLMDEPLARRGRAMLEALAETKPPGTNVTSSYVGDKSLLVLYGVGRATRFPLLKAHLAKGGHVACWDLGYFDRDDGMRVSIDGLHPTAEQLALAPDGERRPVKLREDAHTRGPILLCGLGRKSAHMYGIEPHEWERAKLEQLLERFPKYRIHWRPKGSEFLPLAGLTSKHGMPIEAALRGCALVVCRHSNVAIDACIAGVPVECEDGAARALYANEPDPTPAQRAEFLRRLAWWNWRPHEARQAWAWMQRAIA
jgi:hypothetical protein